MNKDFDVVIICGGLGTRFQEVSREIPKSMTRMYGKPLLDIIIDFFRTSGFHRFILCTGHLADYIEQYYKGSSYSSSIVFSKEREPLGTGGAIKNAQNFIQTKDFFVVNGDSYCEIDLPSFVGFHFSVPGAFVSMALARYDERTDAGDVVVDENTHAITAFHEKSNQRGQFRNAGIYIFNKKVFDCIPDQQNYSLEYSLFPSLTNKGLYGFVTNSSVIDIGTPERYAKALFFFARRNDKG